MSGRYTQDDSSVLLSYTHRYNRRLTWFLVLLILALNAAANIWSVYVLFIADQPAAAYVRVGMLAVVTLLVVGLGLWFEGRVAIAFACTDSGIEIASARGRRAHIPWKEIQIFKRAAFGFAILKSRNRPAVYLPAHEKWRDELLALLREASNARIVGFDSVS